MADLSLIFTGTTPTYQRPEDLDFPVSKIRLFIDVLWQSITGKPLTDDQKTTLKQLIDLLNLLDEHKHEPQKELIAAMLPSISPLLEKMPTLGLTGTHVFTHLVPIYQLYLPSIEQMVKDAHPFTLEETLLYYELTIFDHLFLVHIFEQEHELNMIELLLTIKAIILINALVYDYQQHVKGRSISFFTFLMRGGMAAEKLQPFLIEAIDYICNEVKLTVQNAVCLETLEFLRTKLLDTTQAKPTDIQGEQKEEGALTQALAPQTPPEQTNAVFEQATPLVTEDVQAQTPEPMVASGQPIASTTTPEPPTPPIQTAPVAQESIPTIVSQPIPTNTPQTQPMGSVVETIPQVTSPVPPVTEIPATPSSPLAESPQMASTSLTGV